MDTVTVIRLIAAVMAIALLSVVVLRRKKRA